jgi:hypothetical protein
MAKKSPTTDKGLICEMDLKKDKEGFEVQFSSKGYSITGTAPWKTCE